MKLLWILIGIIGATLIFLMLSGDRGSFIGIQNDQLARAVFMSVWAILIGAAIIPRSGGIGEFARNAALWVIIFLVLTAGYIYRYELQDMGARISGGLIPGSPISTSTIDGRASVTLIRSDNGQFEADGTVDGNTVRFLVDTGASIIVLSQEDAQRTGIDTQTLEYNMPVLTANGRTEAARITLSNVSIGNISRNRVAAMVAKPGNLNQSLLGMNFVETLWGFEIRGDRLILTD